MSYLNRNSSQYQISITGVDRSSIRPAGSTGSHSVTFTISGSPQNNWITLFDEEVKEGGYSYLETARVHSSLQTVSILCPLEELKDQLELLKMIFAKTNSALYEKEEAAAARYAEVRSRRERLTPKIDEIVDDLKF